MFMGSCQCESVRFEVTALLPVGLHCHCSICRKIAGAAFASSVMVERAGFRIVAGAEDLATHNASADFDRLHCKRCHAVVYGDTRSYAEWPLFVSAAALDPRALAGVSFHHIFVASKAPWYEITNQQPRFESAPPYLTSPAALDLSAYRAPCL